MRVSIMPIVALLIWLIFPFMNNLEKVPSTNQNEFIDKSESMIYLPMVSSQVFVSSDQSRGYLTTPQELFVIKQKSDQGIEPYRGSVEAVLEWADKAWDYDLDAYESCANSDDPAWIDNQEGTPILYSKALAYHLTGESRYSEEVKKILQRIMMEVKKVSIEEDKCQLTFAWGTPELVASADLIEDHWKGQTCNGPISTFYSDTTFGWGDCKVLFQNWLVKNPYYIVSYSAVRLNNNWGAAATTTTAYIADYLWDRREVRLIHRNPWQVNNGEDIALSPAEAYAYANQLAIDRMNGDKIAYSVYSCDMLSGDQQSSQWSPIKSQITETGVIPEEALREEFCNIPMYNGEHQGYPQLHLGNNIQQCELMLRRGDSSCYDNVDNIDIPNFTYAAANRDIKSTHLKPGRGSIERAIKAVIVDSNTPWERDEPLAVAYRYYYNYHTLPGFDRWSEEIDEKTNCEHDICFGILTHGFAPGENPGLPPTVSPPTP